MIIESIRKRGFLRAGVSLGFPGFSWLNPATNQWEGFDIELARAVSAAVLGDKESIEFIPLPSSDRFHTLQNNQIDIGTYNASITLSREIISQVHFTHPMLYDGEGLLARKTERDENASTWVNLLSCHPRIAALKGSTTHENLIHFFQSHNYNFDVALYHSPKEAYQAHDDGECNIFCLDRYLLAGIQTVLRAPSEHEILPYIISREAMAPFVSDSDPQWRATTTWIMRTLIEAESLGINRQNIEEFNENKDSYEYRLLNPPDFFCKYLGLDRHYVKTIIRSVGNYENIFENTLGSRSNINAPRRENRPWRQGGMLWCPNFI
ncbi:transporter substrate-binding domain-containing protein [Lonsdalea quercina]|uniref:transporter substrate-binding domain-containing protein n=1 Tax=Lonsdalea quercina TaxID=71657 RepID=UPI00397642EC